MYYLFLKDVVFFALYSVFCDMIQMYKLQTMVIDAQNFNHLNILKCYKLNLNNTFHFLANKELHNRVLLFKLKVQK